MAYLVHVAVLVGINAIVAISLELLIGEVALVCVAQAAFAAIGAYATTILLLQADMNFFVAAALGMLLSGTVALVLGAIFLRLKEVYYVLGTAGFNIIVWSITLNWSSLTNGPMGIAGVPAPALFGFRISNNVQFLILVMVVLALVYALAQLIKRSSFGRVLNAIREDEEASAVFGYDAARYKLMIFVISAALAALGGEFFAGYITYIDPTSFTINYSIFLLAVVILGGLGSVRGAIVGALILVVLPEAFRFIGFPSDVAAQMRQVCYGLLLIFLMLYRPQGILGTFK